jgi:HK97 family phage portal protein
MGWRQRLAVTAFRAIAGPRPFERKQSLATAAILSLGPQQASWLQQDYETFAREGYQGNPYVFAAIHQIAMAVAGIPWQVFADESKKKPFDTHPILDLLRRPNPGQSGGRFFENWVGYKHLDGNAYIERAGTGALSGIPDELYVLRPDRMRIIPGTVAQPVAGYIYKIGGAEVPYPAEAILHDKFFNPLNDWYGMSPLAAASKSVDQSNASKAWNVGMLQHGATPSGTLTAPTQVEDVQYRRLTEWVEEQYAGWTNAGRPMVLENGMTWAQMGMSPIDMAWLEGQKLSAREIAMVFNIAPELIGDPDSKTFSNYQEARKALYEENVLPLMDGMRDDLNAWIAEPAECYLDYDRDEIEALQEDRNAIYTRNNGAFASGWLRLGDAQQAAGVDVDPDYGNYYFWQLPQHAAADPGPWRDPQVVYDEAQQQAQDQQAMQQQQAQAQLEAAKAAQQQALPAAGQSSASDESNPDSGAETTGGTKELVRDHTVYAHRSTKARRMTDAEVKAHKQDVEALREKWIGRMRDAVREQLQPLVKVAQDTPKLHAALLKQRDAWQALVEQYFYQVAPAFAAHTVGSLADRGDRDDFDPQNPAYLASFGARLDAYVEQYVPARVDRIVASLGTALPARLATPPIRESKATLNDSSTSGTDTSWTADDISEFLDGAADTIAESEVVAASNLGPLLGAQAFGASYGAQLVKTWQALHDDKTRPTHADADGQSVLMEDPFDVGGEQLMFPLDESLGAGPEETRWCRCVTTFDVTEAAGKAWSRRRRLKEAARQTARKVAVAPSREELPLDELFAPLLQRAEEYRKGKR